MLISIQFTKGLIMKVSIIIPCYNAIGKVEKCLSSLRLLDFSLDNYEVIFVDLGWTFNRYINNILYQNFN